MKFLIIDDEHELYKVMFSDAFKPSKYDVTELPRFNKENKILHTIRRIHFNDKINRRIWLPLKNLWDNRYSINYYNFDAEEQYCVIFLNGIFRYYYSYKYLEKFKYNHKNVKLVMIMYDSFSNHTAQRAISFLSLFDVVFSFDQGDCERHGFTQIYSTFSNPDSLEKQPKIFSKAFCIATGCGRLKIMQECFRKIASEVEECDFTIVGVTEHDQKYCELIRYNKPISFREELEKSYNSDCLVEIVRKGQCGITLRTCEAIAFNKKLLTNNKELENLPFYNPTFMKIFESVDEIDCSFFGENMEVHYDYHNEFSPIYILSILEDKFVKGISS